MILNGKADEQKRKTNNGVTITNEGDQSPTVIGDSATIIFNNENSNKPDKHEE